MWFIWFVLLFWFKLVRRYTKDWLEKKSPPFGAISRWTERRLTLKLTFTVFVCVFVFVAVEFCWLLSTQHSVTHSLELTVSSLVPLLPE